MATLRKNRPLSAKSSSEMAVAVAEHITTPAATAASSAPIAVLDEVGPTIASTPSSIRSWVVSAAELAVAPSSMIDILTSLPSTPPASLTACTARSNAELRSAPAVPTVGSFTGISAPMWSTPSSRRGWTGFVVVVGTVAIGSASLVVHAAMTKAPTVSATAARLACRASGPRLMMTPYRWGDRRCSSWMLDAYDLAIDTSHGILRLETNP